VILLTQNHRLTRYATAEILRDAGYDVLEAADGREALLLLKTHPFDLIITDILMPNPGGLAVAARARLQWPKIPIILTGYMTEIGVATLLASPMKFLQKPFNAEDLTASVQRMLDASC
jgi:CheY-like chemotaxis protein